MTGELNERRWLLVVLLAAGVLRAFPYWFGLPHFEARPDESVSTGIALGILRGDPNPHFFHWPSLTFYLFAAMFWVARGLRRLWAPDALWNPGDYYVLGRLLVAAAGTATVAVIFAIGKRVAGIGVGLIGAALLAVAILHVRESHFAMTDVIMTFFVTVSLAALLRGYDASIAGGPAWSWFAGAGLLAGLAASTKYNAAAVGASMIAAQILLLVRQPRLRTLAPSVLYGLLFVAGFLGASPYALLDFEKFREDILFDVTHLSGGHGIDLGRGWVYHVTRSLPFGLGPLTFVAAVIGVIPMAWKYPRHTAILGAFAAMLYLSVGSGYTVFFRYILPLIPLACLSAAVGIQEVGKRLGGSKAVASTAFVIVVAGLVNAVWFDVLLARTDSRVLAARWLAAQLQREDTLHDAGGPYSALGLAEVPFHEWKFDANANSFGAADGKTPDWLVLYESPLHTYTRMPWQLRTLAATSYTLAHSIQATTGARRDAVYDLQDAFFMPVWGLWTVERPGPTVLIYRLKPQ